MTTSEFWFEETDSKISVENEHGENDCEINYGDELEREKEELNPPDQFSEICTPKSEFNPYQGYSFDYDEDYEGKDHKGESWQ